eukprot:gene12041-biopygen7866
MVQHHSLRYVVSITFIRPSKTPFIAST